MTVNSAQAPPPVRLIIGVDRAGVAFDISEYRDGNLVANVLVKRPGDALELASRLVTWARRRLAAGDPI